MSLGNTAVRSEPSLDPIDVERAPHHLGEAVEAPGALGRDRREPTRRRETAGGAGRADEGVAEGVVVEESVQVGPEDETVSACRSVAPERLLALAPDLGKRRGTGFIDRFSHVNLVA